MATVNSVIEKVNSYHPDDISTSIKYRWLGELDNKKYSCPEDGETELVIKSPYDKIYELYIVAMSDFFSCNMRSYEISAGNFQIEYEKLKSGVIFVADTNTCVSCGEIIPEGRMVCGSCENR